MDQGAALEAVEPILARIPIWWREAYAAYLAKFDAGERLILGRTHRSMFVQRIALSNVRRDPLISGYFKPAEQQRLEFLQYDGLEADLAVLFKKLRYYGGRLYSSNIRTIQQNDRLAGRLPFGGKELLPLVCGYTTVDDQIDHVFIGEETQNGFMWFCTLWSDDGGLYAPIIDPQPILFPAARVKIRQPAAAATTNGKKIGTAKTGTEGNTDRGSSEKSA